MKNNARSIYAMLLILLSLTMSGCAELFDCVASARPNIHSKVLIIGNVGYMYNDFIEADVTNDSNDNSYDYYFSLEGDLPPGMTYHEQGRKVFFSGIPTQAGSYRFRIKLTVDPDDSYNPDEGFFEDGNHICFGDDTTTKEFTIVVQ